MYSETVVIANTTPQTLMRNGGVLNQPEGVVFTVTTAWLYILPLITCLPNK